LGWERVKMNVRRYKTKNEMKNKWTMTQLKVRLKVGALRRMMRSGWIHLKENVHNERINGVVLHP
jgi:hypothetical protein